MLLINSGFSGAEDVILILLIKKPPVCISLQIATTITIGRNWVPKVKNKICTTGGGANYPTLSPNPLLEASVFRLGQNDRAKLPTALYGNLYASACEVFYNGMAMCQ